LLLLGRRCGKQRGDQARQENGQRYNDQRHSRLVLLTTIPAQIKPGLAPSGASQQTVQRHPEAAAGDQKLRRSTRNNGGRRGLMHDGVVIADCGSSR